MSAKGRIKWSPDHRQILWALATHSIYNLYHFTAVSNLPRIFRTGAVCSREVLDTKNKLHLVECGGTDRSHQLDDILGNDRYVSLSYKARMPMAYECERVSHLCYLVFDCSVAARRGVLFTNRNAASPAAQRAEGLEGLRAVNFEAVLSNSARRGTDAHTLRQAEVLVPGQISTNDILYVAFRSQASLEEGRRLCQGSDRLPPFRAEPRLFHLHAEHHFGCVNAVLLNRHRYLPGVTTVLDDDQLNRMLNGSGTGGGTALKLKSGISLVQRLVTVPQLLLTVTWYSRGKKVSTVMGLERAHKPFSGGGDSEVCTTLGPEQLKPGKWRVTSDLRLNNVIVRQISMPFDLE